MAKGKFLVAEPFEFLVVMWRVSKLVQGQNNLYIYYFYIIINYYISLTRRFKSIKILNPIGQKAISSKSLGPGPYWFEGPKTLIIKDFLSHSSHFRVSEIFASIVF